MVYAVLFHVLNFLLTEWAKDEVFRFCFPDDSATVAHALQAELSGKIAGGAMHALEACKLYIESSIERGIVHIATRDPTWARADRRPALMSGQRWFTLAELAPAAFLADICGVIEL
ncbi:MAG: hypothetical protein ACU0BO_16035 [Limimaricola soesokkakensis]|uniref:hypothetical protein n=1 Tax=Limimaricola soesokkakensis TaxID=1343159 RepID=UPI004058BE8B